RQIEANMQVTGGSGTSVSTIFRGVWRRRMKCCADYLADKILIVEDERITAEDLEEVLKDLGYQVSGVVSSSEEAIREAQRNPPDLVLMDIRIRGEIDGAETALLLRERYDVPVVYLTARADRDTLERAKQSRPLGYIVKPFHEAELHASVEMALYKHRHDRR